MNSDNRSFDSNFEVFLADTPESKEIHYNLRYQVYCDEMGYEDRDAFPDRLEFDEWDDSAVHFLVRHRYTGHWLGSLRLVRYDGRGFPLERWCELENPISTEQYRQSVELSRLCVIKEARRFSARKFAPYGVLGHSHDIRENANVRVLHSHKNLGLTIMWGLLRAGAQYCEQNGIQDLYLLVAPALAFAIRKEGFGMEQAGNACQHKGERIPFVWEINDVLANTLWQKDYKNGFCLYSEAFDKRLRCLKFA